MLVQWLSQLLKAKPLSPKKKKKIAEKAKNSHFPCSPFLPLSCSSRFLLCSHSCWQCGDRHLGKTTGLPRTFAAACRFFVFITTTNRVNELTAGSQLESGLRAGGQPKCCLPSPPSPLCAAPAQQKKRQEKKKKQKQPPKATRATPKKGSLRDCVTN